jgi:hypothetical protein
MALLKSETGSVKQATEAASGDTGEQITETRGADLALVASAASVVLAWYQFYLKGNKTRGLFIGLWPPTILAFAGYLNEKAILDKLDQTLLRSTDSFGSIRKIIGE